MLTSTPRRLLPGVPMICSDGDPLCLAIEAAGLMDEAWYAARNPDVGLSGLAPILHFLRIGARLGRPCCDGDVDLLISHLFPDIVAGGEMRPLMAWLKAGGPPLPRHRMALAAKALAEAGHEGLARRMLRHHLGARADGPIALIAANDAIGAGGWEAWLAAVNDYLHPFGLAPLALREEGGLIERLVVADLPIMSGGPLVSVIMPAFNAEATIEAAARSILRQTWGNLELLIVDDASTDGTWARARALAEADARVRIRRNPVRVGPYVCKNLALRDASGAFFTGHDADDWSHPQRIERHIFAFLDAGGTIKAGTMMMLRVTPEGCFDNVIASSGHHSPDGFRRRAFVSCLFNRQAFDAALGAYDSALFGADGEIMGRARQVFGEAMRDMDTVALICLDRAGSLTNDPRFGLQTDGGPNALRLGYAKAYSDWHRNTAPADLRMDPRELRRRFSAPEACLPSPGAILQASSDKVSFATVASAT